MSWEAPIVDLGGSDDDLQQVRSYSKDRQNKQDDLYLESRPMRSDDEVHVEGEEVEEINNQK